MSTSLEHPPSGKYVDFPEYVDFQLHKARQQIRSMDLLTAAAIAGVLFVGYPLLFVVADHWLLEGGMPPAVRWLGLLVWLALLGAWIVAKVAIPLMRNVTGLFAAKEVERAEPALRSNLLNWVDLQQAGRNVDPAVLRAIERQAAVQLSKFDVGQAVDHRPLLRAGYLLCALVAAACVYALVTPKKIGPSLARVLPLVDVAVPTRTEIRNVDPGDARVLARSVLEVTVDLAGVIPPKVELLYTTADQRFRDEPLTLSPDGAAGTRFRTVLAGEGGQGLLQDLSYRVKAGDVVSRDYQVTVDQPPSVRVTEVQITPPGYTGLPQDTANSGNFTGWEGSTVTINGESNVALKSAVIEFLEEPQGKPTGEQVAMTIQQGTQLAGSWTLAFREDGTFPRHYRVQCKTDDGRYDPAPVVYEYEIRRDQPPEIALLSPERDISAPANARIPLLIQARDPDFLLGPITLEIQRQGKVIGRETLSQGNQPAVQFQHEFALQPLGLSAGDEIVYWIVAQDNRKPRRNRKQTPPLKISIQAPADPSKVQAQLDEDKARQREQLEELEKSQQKSEPQPGDRPDESEPAERMSSDQPEEQQKDPREQPDAQPNDKGAAGSQTPGERGENDNRDAPANQPSSPTSEPGGKNDRPAELSPDGEDDQQLLEKLLQRYPRKPEDAPPSDQPQPQDQPPQSPMPEDQKQQQQPNDGNEMPSENSQQQKSSSPSDPSEPMPREGEQKGDASSGQRNATSPQQPGGEANQNSQQQQQQPQQSSDKPSGDNKSGTSEPMPNAKSPRDGQQAGKSSDQQPTSSSSKPQDQPSGGETKDATSPSKTEQSKTSPTSSADRPSQAMERPQPGEREPQQNSDTAADSGTASKSDKPGEASGSPKTGTEADRQGKPSEKPQADPQKNPDSSQPDGKNSGESTPETSPPKNGSSSKGDRAKPGEAQNEPESKGTPPDKGSPPKSSAQDGAADPKNQPADAPKESGAGKEDAPEPSNGESSKTPPSDGKSMKPNGEQPPEAAEPGGAKPDGKSEPSKAQEPGDKPQPDASKEGAAPPQDAPSPAKGDMPPTKGDEAAADGRDANQPSPSGKNASAPEKMADNAQGEPSSDPSPAGERPQQSPPPSGRPPADDQMSKGEGRPNGQRSDKPQTGENGGAQESTDGNSGSQQRGPGETTKSNGGQSTGEKSSSPSESSQNTTPNGEPSSSPSNPKSDDSKPSQGQPSPNGKTSTRPASDSAEPSSSKESGSGNKEASGQNPGKAASDQSPPAGGEKSDQSPSGDGKPMDGKSGGQDSSKGQGGQQPGGQQPGGQQPGGQQPGGQQAGGQQPGGQQAGGQQQGQGGQQRGPAGKNSPAGQAGPSNGMTPTGAGPVGNATSSGTASTGSTAAPDSGAPLGTEADLAHKKQAAELVLQQLKQGMERGDVDQQLLDELGWTPDQLSRFVDRMSESLRTADEAPATPAEQARQLQFQEMLKTLQMKQQSDLRSGADSPTREVDQVDSRRAPVPLEYRRAWENYTNRLSKQPARPNGKK